MPKILMILEVSEKQKFIFGSKYLCENVARSAYISYIIGNDFFEFCNRIHVKQTGISLYTYEENMVYSHGGHTVLQFDDQKEATAFATVVTETALRELDGLVLYVKQIPYDRERSPSENLGELIRQLERKKALCSYEVRGISFGIEKPHVPMVLGERKSGSPFGHLAPVGYTFPEDFDTLAGEDNLIAVVHIDGNGMRDRVNSIYERADTDNWDICRSASNRFSKGVQQDYEEAFASLCKGLASQYAMGGTLPICPVVLTGDTVCFVTSGSLGVSCANGMLQELDCRKNLEDGLPYTACAGVAVVHKEYPLYGAYKRSEELCRNAKIYSETNYENSVKLSKKIMADF